MPSLRRFSCFGARSHFFEAQRIVPLDAYTQDIEVLLLHCQQKNAYRDGENAFALSRLPRITSVVENPTSKTCIAAD
jgi:hypothetical protein